MTIERRREEARYGWRAPELITKVPTYLPICLDVDVDYGCDSLALVNSGVGVVCIRKAEWLKIVVRSCLLLTWGGEEGDHHIIMQMQEGGSVPGLSMY